VFFVIVKPVNMIMERVRRPEVEGVGAPTQEELLTEIRDLLARQAR
jgi:large-conductance mechanosensitive channel